MQTAMAEGRVTAREIAQQHLMCSIGRFPISNFTFQI
jgi:hypothetical protein